MSDKAHKCSDAERAKARERMARRRQTPEYREWLRRSRELRRGLKEKYRRQAGARPRADIAAKAAAAREAQATSREHRRMLRGLHDAHVKRWERLKKAREMFAARYTAAPGRERERVSARKWALVDSYVAQQLRAMGVPQESITAELIELKREAIQFRRLSRQAKKLIANQRKEAHETVTKHA